MLQKAEHIFLPKTKTAGEGKIYICPTPIGNRADISLRVLEVLRSVDTVYAEDTRVSAKILAMHGIEAHVERLDEAVMSKKLDGLINRVCAGEHIAYCSDAGMPGISDPGLRLVRAAQEAKVSYCVLPGPSATTTAYVASGFTHPHFYFGGFFPRKGGEIKNLLESLKVLDAVLIFYESPKRLTNSLNAIARSFPLREVAVCRELTKLHEEIVRLSAIDIYEFFAQRETLRPIKGEIVVVIDAPHTQEQADDEKRRITDAQKQAQKLKDAGTLYNKEIVSHLQEEFGLARNVAYDIVHKM